MIHTSIHPCMHDAAAVTCSADKDPWPTIYSNSLSALAAAEMTRRIALHREIQPALRFPGVEWVDIQVDSISLRVSLCK